MILNRELRQNIAHTEPCVTLVQGMGREFSKNHTFSDRVKVNKIESTDAHQDFLLIALPITRFISNFFCHAHQLIEIDRFLYIDIQSFEMNMSHSIEENSA